MIEDIKNATEVVGLWVQGVDARIAEIESFRKLYNEEMLAIHNQNLAGAEYSSKTYMRPLPVVMVATRQRNNPCFSMRWAHMKFVKYRNAKSAPNEKRLNYLNIRKPVGGGSLYRFSRAIDPVREQVARDEAAFAQLNGALHQLARIRTAMLRASKHLERALEHFDGCYPLQLDDHHNEI